jgi:hypothetical protein
VAQSETPEDRKAERLIKTGIEAAGGAAGAAAGSLLGGPLGAALGGATGEAVTRVLADIYDRAVSPRERIRMGTAACYAIARIKERQDAGEAPRQDGFFDFDTSRSDADEIFEGCLLKSKNSHEERKAKYCGEFFASVAFDENVSRTQANYWLSIIDRLTYCQLCLLSLFSRDSVPALHDSRYAGMSVSWETISIVSELLEMNRLGLVDQFGSDGTRNILLDGLPDIILAQVRANNVGKRLASLMRLDTIPGEDIEELVRHLRKQVEVSTTEDGTRAVSDEK